MAEMNVPESGAKKGKKKVRSKKMSTRVDLTAMVDLGFLLITFFMLATTFNKPKTMEIVKPIEDDKKDQPEIKMSKTLSILLGMSDKVYFYVSPDDASAVSVDSTDFSADGIRKVIYRRQKEVASQYGSADSMFVMIKALPQSKYKNTVDILDEMRITNTGRYALIEMNDIDTLIAKKSGLPLN